MSRHASLIRLALAAALALATPAAAHATGQGTYTETTGFGANPGALKMYVYVPPEPALDAGVVFALHGCTSSASDYRKAGWEELADAYGFYVVYPQQGSSNNPAMCFNWAGDWGSFGVLERGQDENQSIANMALHMQAEYGVDPDRVFITGHSAGAAMVAVVLATWPDVFAAGASIAGVPYKCPSSYGDVYTCMSPGKDLDAATWGDRAASGDPGYAGPFPRLSVWHGTSDFTVAPANALELVEQFTALHGADATPDMTDEVEGYPHEVYLDAAGDAVVERYEITGKAHAVFLDPDNGCGQSGSYFVDADICSTLYIAEWFGLLDDGDDTGTTGDDTGTTGDDTGTTGDDTGTTGDDTGTTGDDTGTTGDDTGTTGDTTGTTGDDTGTTGDTTGTTGDTTGDTTGTVGDTTGTTGSGLQIPVEGSTECGPQEIATLGCSGAGAPSGGLAVALLVLAWLVVRRRRRLAAVVALAATTGACNIGMGGPSPEPASCDDGTSASNVFVPDSGDGTGAATTTNACTSALQARASEVAGQLSGWSIDDAPEMVASGGSEAREADFAGKYRDDLSRHPGCVPRAAYGPNTSEPFSTDNAAAGTPGSPAAISGYPCAAKAYTQPSEDTSKPIVLLFHGNSAGATAWEPYSNQTLAGTEQQNLAGFTFLVDAQARDQLAGQLVARGYRVAAFDARTDLVGTLDDWDSSSETGNPFMNTDHGWTVPMAQRLIWAVMRNNPGRKVALIGHSLGATVIRDAVRRLYVAWRRGDADALNPFVQLSDVIMLSGAHHGVSTGPLCNVFPHMRGTVCCEMGDRGAYVPTYFHKPLNGPRDLFSAPCADGSYAYGAVDQCGGSVVDYTTVTMIDIDAGDYQDEFVSEESSRLDLEPCVDNALIGLEDSDTSGYFFTGRPGFLASHFGSARSEAGMALVLQKLAD